MKPTWRRLSRLALTLLALAALLTSAAGQTQSRDPTKLQPLAPQQQLEIPQARVTTVPSQAPALETENDRAGQELTTFLHGHRLPYVQARVFEAGSGSQRVELSGWTATTQGREDAAEKSRQFLGTSQMVVVNQITVDPLVRSNPPSVFVSRGQVGEILPPTFHGCWAGTVDRTDWERDIPPFASGGWISETYRLCYVQQGSGGPFNLTFTNVKLDPSSARAVDVHVNDFAGHVEVVSTDHRDRAELRARLIYQQTATALLGLLSQRSVNDETVDLQCRISNRTMIVKAHFSQTCDGRLCFEGGWHQSFLPAAD